MIFKSNSFFFIIAFVYIFINQIKGNRFYEKFLKRNFFMNEKDTIDLINNVSIPIENTCIASYKNLAQVSSQFIQCVANYSRPYHVCQNCLIYYLKFNEANILIKENTDIYAQSLYKDGLTCENIVKATDRVQSVVRISNTIQEIWDASRCEDCFENYSLINGTLNFSLKESIVTFYQIQQNLEICINEFTNKPSSLDPLFQDYEANNTLCQVCKNLYVNLTRHFLNMGKQNGSDENSMCMDPVDLFNYTRVAWSKGYKCNYRQIDELNILIISGIVIGITILFYVIATLQKSQEKRQYVKIFRKRSAVILQSTRPT